MADLLAVIAQGDLGAAKAILEADKESCAALSDHGVSALMIALYHQQTEIADLIAEARQSSSVALDVHELASLGRSEELGKLLGDGKNTSLDLRSPDGFTPLHFAAFFGHPETAAVLIERGAQVGSVAENPTRVQPLHSAVARGDLETARLLIEHGADVNAKQQNDFTPLMGAAFEGSAALVQILLDAGADPQATNGDTKTAADLARDKGNDEALSLL